MLPSAISCCASLMASWIADEMTVVSGFFAVGALPGAGFAPQAARSGTPASTAATSMVRVAAIMRNSWRMERARTRSGESVVLRHVGAPGHAAVVDRAAADAAHG